MHETVFYCVHLGPNIISPRIKRPSAKIVRQNASVSQLALADGSFVSGLTTHWKTKSTLHQLSVYVICCRCGKMPGEINPLLAELYVCHGNREVHQKLITWARS